ncbi:MAG: hypothetical protein ACKVGT_10370 [Flavobacteriales bacterium]
MRTIIIIITDYYGYKNSYFTSFELHSNTKRFGMSWYKRLDVAPTTGPLVN